MINVDNIMAIRLQELKARKNCSNTEIANAVGVSSAAVGLWLKTGGIKQNHIKKICNFFDVDPKWLLGYSNDFVECHLSDHMPQNAMDNDYIKVAIYYGEEKKLIKDKKEPHLFLHKSILPVNGKFYGLKIKDRSLAPELSPDDFVILDQQEQAIIDGGTFAIWFKDMLIVRKITLTNHGYCLATNNNATHAITVTDQDDFKILGKIILKVGKVF